MSLSFYWQPSQGRCLSVSTPSRLVDAMQRAFGSGPWELDTSHIATLSGMAAMSDELRPAINELIDGIGTHGTVRVWTA